MVRVRGDQTLCQHVKIHKGLWEGFAENLLDAATLLHSLRDMWDALPLANHESHETAWTKRNRQVLHQAESVTVGGYELSQQCRSYRYAAEILDP